MIINDNLSISPRKKATCLYGLHMIKYLYTKHLTTIRRNEIDV